MEIVALPRNSVRGDAARGSGLRPAKTTTASDSTTPPTWHDELRLALRDPVQLIAALELPAELLESAQRAASLFPLFAPWPYISRMAKGDPADPLLRQVLPLGEELDDPPGFASDPV